MEIKGTIKYVLIVLLLFHKYILYLSQIHPVSKISVTDVGGYSAFNIHSRMIPGSTWSVLHPIGSPPGSPQFLGDMGFIHGSRLLSRVAKSVPLDLVSLWKGLPPGPFTPKALPCHQCFAHQFLVCFLCGIRRRTFMRNHPLIRRFYY